MAAFGAAGLVLHRRSVPRATFGSVVISAVVAETLLVPLAARTAIAPAAFAATIVAGIGLILGVRYAADPLVRSATQTVSVIAVAAMASLAFATPHWGAAALTATVPLFAIAALGTREDTYRWFAAGAALAATWAWMATSNVTLVEAYTVPAAALALGAGWVTRDHQRRSTSWSAYGPALVIGLGPSLYLALTETGTIRPQTLFVIAVGTTLIGVGQRLQAPIVAGAITIAVLGIDTLWPVAARLERWVLLSIAGAVFIWLGASLERRLRQLRRAHDGLRHLQ